MVTDVLGNQLKEGDNVLFQNIVYSVKKINEGNIVGASRIETISPGKQKIQGMVIPGTITLEATIGFDPTKPLNMYVVKTPSNQEVAKLSEGSN